MTNIYNKYLIWSKDELNQIQKQRTLSLSKNGNAIFTVLFFNKRYLYNEFSGNVFVKSEIKYLDNNKDFAVILQQGNIFLYVREDYGI